MRSVSENIPQNSEQELPEASTVAAAEDAESQAPSEIALRLQLLGKVIVPRVQPPA